MLSCFLNLSIDLLILFIHLSYPTDVLQRLSNIVENSLFPSLSENKKNMIFMLSVFTKKVALHAVMIEPNKIKYKVKIFPI